MKYLSVGSTPVPILGRSLEPAALSTILIVAGCVSFQDAHAAQVAGPEQKQADGCGSAEDCFAAAAWPKERLGSVLTKEQVAALKLERLLRVMEQFPVSLRARRAGLLSGVMLVERDPAGAHTYLRAAERDFPVLDYYVRLWIGEALLHLGDPKEAAVMFEAVPQAVSDSTLLPQVALRVGEACGA